MYDDSGITITCDINIKAKMNITPAIKAPNPSEASTKKRNKFMNEIAARIAAVICNHINVTINHTRFRL